MKTLLFTIEYPPFYGGIANYYGNLVKYFPGEITVLDNHDNKLVRKDWPVLKWLPSVFKLYKEIKKNKTDHIIVGQILPLGLPACIVGKMLKKPYSVMLHGMDFAFALKSARKEMIARLVLKNAKNIICANSYTAEIVKDFLGKGEKVYIVNPGIEVNYELRITNYELRKKYGLENKIILLSVGRLVKRKGVDKVIESLPEVLKEVSEIVYVIVGRGEELDNLKSKIKDLKLEDHVIIITDADDNDKWSWYAASDIFVMPSRNIAGDFEGFGIVYLEANLAEKPVIAGASGGVTDAVENEVNGLLVDPEDKSAIANAIIRLAGNKELREQLGQRGRFRALEKFDWKKQAAKICEVINHK